MCNGFLNILNSPKILKYVSHIKRKDKISRGVLSQISLQLLSIYWLLFFAAFLMWPPHWHHLGASKKLAP